MMWLSNETEWLASRVDKWVAQCRGYSKLRSCRISRGYQTMMAKPDPCKIFWSRADCAFLDDVLEIDTSCAIPEPDNRVTSSKPLDESSYPRRASAESSHLKPQPWNSNEISRHSQSLRELNYLNELESSKFYPRVALPKPKLSENISPAGSQFLDHYINVNDDTIEVVQSDVNLNYDNDRSYTDLTRIKNNANVLRSPARYRECEIEGGSTRDLNRNYEIERHYSIRNRRCSSKNMNRIGGRPVRIKIYTTKIYNSRDDVRNINKSYSARNDGENHRKAEEETSDWMAKVLREDFDYSDIFKKCKPRRNSNLNELQGLSFSDAGVDHLRNYQDTSNNLLTPMSELSLTFGENDAMSYPEEIARF